MKIVVLLLVCLLGSVFCQQQLHTCTSDDLSGDYTRCISLSSTRTLYYYYSGCNATDAPAPPNPISDLPCDISCDPGWFLPLESSTCEICEPGTFSLGGGSRFYQWEDNFPKTPSVLFKTYCSESDSIVPSEELTSCGWTLDGYHTNSGDLTGLQSVNSILEISVILLEDGKIGFEYMCDVEHDGDVFVYKLNDDYPVALSTSAEYIYRSIPLPAGTHKLRWIYYKDPQIGNGEDVASIAFVEVYGLQAADDKSCTLCPPGKYQSDEGQEYCFKCPANTYSPDYGYPECLPCPSGSYSYEGSFECIEYDNPCTVDNNAITYYSECIHEDGEWVRTQYTQWEVPLFCDNTGIELPANVTGQECAPCPPGSYYVGSRDIECMYCNDGEYSSGPETCSTCDDGYIAIPEVYYTEWDYWPSGFESFCYGECAGTQGFQLYHDSVRASVNAGVVNDLLLTVTVEVGYGGAFEYAWRIHGSMAGSESYFKVTVDGLVVSRDDSGHATQKNNLSYGMHVIGFWVHGSGEVTSRVDISTLTIIASAVGGASECTPCPVGYYQGASDQQYCVPCQFGTYNDEEGATKCKKCPADTYASRSGSAECMPCPTGTHSNKGSGYCQNPDCTFQTEDENFLYNLSPYAGIPQYVDNEEQQNGYFLVSYCGFLYETDSECKDSFVCETFDKFNPFAPARDYINWASTVDFNEASNPKEGFSLKFSDGEAVGCSDGMNRTVIVEFTCESDPTLYTSLEYSSSESTECRAVFKQTSVYGCPVCSYDDFERKEGECEDGEMTVEFKKKKSSHCNGVVKNSVETCGDVTLGFGLAVVVIVSVLLVLLLLLVAVGWFVMKHQRLKIKYSQLRASNVEMTELDEDDEVAE